MGLDMYLFKAKKGVSKYDEDELEEIGYWRKANQIHNWFVNNVQDGIDECQYSLVSEEDLLDLLNVCKTVLQKGDYKSFEELLPRCSGFFFGSTEYDIGYIYDIKATIKILEEVLDNTDFETEDIIYSSSW